VNPSSVPHAEFDVQRHTVLLRVADLVSLPCSRRCSGWESPATTTLPRNRIKPSRNGRVWSMCRPIHTCADESTDCRGVGSELRIKSSIPGSSHISFFELGLFLQQRHSGTKIALASSIGKFSIELGFPTSGWTSRVPSSIAG
jgi:hypothetical protein